MLCSALAAGTCWPRRLMHVLSGLTQSSLAGTALAGAVPRAGAWLAAPCWSKLNQRFG